MESSLPIINRTYEVYKAILQLNDKLTKRWRNSLGLSAENTLMDLMEHLIMAKDAPKAMKSGYLIRANAKLQITRMKLRLFMELKLVNATKIFQLQAQLEEIGRMLGGWLKSVQ